MLDLAQMESGKYQLNIEDISINRMVKYEVNKFSPLVEKKRIQLTVNIPNEPITVLGDSLRIEQVFC
jgi:two-component system sensor histidine kinase ResE